MVTQNGRMAVENPNQQIVDRLLIGNRDAFIDVSEESSTAIWPLGARLQIGERVYRYAENGSSGIATARLCQMPVIETNGDVTDMAVDTPAIGALQMEVTNGGNTAITANEFTGGWLHVNDDTGEGYLYQIRANDAMSTSAAGTIYLYDPVIVALGAGATVSLTHGMWANTIIHPSPNTAALTGVTSGAITAEYFFWIQTWGPASVLHDGSTVVTQGDPVLVSEDDDGAVTLLDRDASGRDEPEVGWAMHPNADGEHTLIYLRLHP
jgi:hypothetical protein